MCKFTKFPETQNDLSHFFQNISQHVTRRGAGKRLLGFTDLLFDDLQFTKRDVKQMTGPLVFKGGIYC